MRLASPAEKDDILKVAAEVDQRMRDIARQTGTVDSLKVAILTALHLAEESREQHEVGQFGERPVQSDEQITGDLGGAADWQDPRVLRAVPARLPTCANKLDYAADRGNRWHASGGWHARRWWDEPGSAVTFRKWQCIVCGFVYDEEEGYEADGIAPGTRWEEIGRAHV